MTSLLVQFSAGSGTLVCEGNRFVFCSHPVGQIGQLRACLVTAASTRSLFLSITALLLAAIDGAGAEFVVGELDAERTSVLSMGALNVAVSTDNESGVIDAEDVALFSQGVFRGALQSVCVGANEELSFFASPPCVIPSSGFRIVCGSASLVPSLTSSIPSANANSLAEPISRSERVVQEEVLDSEVSETEVQVAEVRVTEVPLTEVQLQPDESDESLTVWPIFGSGPDPTASPTPIAIPSVVSMDDKPTLSETELVNAATPSIHDWEPPSPVFEVGQPTPVVVTVDPSLTWAQPIPLAWSPTDDGEDADLTVRPEDIEQLRRSMVKMAAPATVPAVDSNQVFGVRCPSNHFSDPTKPLCLVCGTELDLAQSQLGPRPVLGQLVFSDGRTVSLDKPVLVGRKPSDSEGAQLVAFPDDMLLSRIHLEVRLVEWSVMVVDRQSANGTNIVHPDGRRVATRANIENPLVSGSTVAFGKASFSFEAAVRG